MSKLSRLIGMASKALDKNGSGSGSGSGSSSGSGDWRSVVRSAADAITGDGRPQGGPSGHGAPAGAAPSPGRFAPPAAGGYAPPPAQGYAPPPAGAGGALGQADRAAIARYDYLMQTADPHQVEQIHRDAFARLSPEQRAHVEARMRAELPPHEQPRSADAGDLARAASRSEAMRPGSMRSLLARVRGGNGGSRLGGMAGGAALGAAGGVLAAVAGGAIVSTVAAPLLAQAAGMGLDFDAIGSGLDLDGIAGGVEGFAGDAISGVGEQMSGFGEQVSGLGEQFGGFDIPGLGGLFDR